MSDGDRPDIDDVALTDSRNRVDAVLADGGVGLDDRALWVEPAPELESSVLAAIAREQGPGTTTQPRRLGARTLRWIVPMAAAAAVIAAFVVTSDQPDWTVTLGATDAAPGAAATASGWNDDNGTRVELDITGLDPAPDGFFYELWFSDEDVHISAGSFHGTGDGVTMWAGVARRDFPRIWITLEPIDDDPAPGINILDTAVLDR